MSARFVLGRRALSDLGIEEEVFEIERTDRDEISIGGDDFRLWFTREQVVELVHALAAEALADWRARRMAAALEREDRE